MKLERSIVQKMFKLSSLAQRDITYLEMQVRRKIKILEKREVEIK